MQNLTVWDAVAACQDKVERRATVVYHGETPVLVARHWIAAASPVLHHRELKENYGLLAILMKAADYAEVAGRARGEIRAHWSAICALTGFHRTSVNRKLIELAQAGYIAYEPSAGRNMVGITIPEATDRSRDQVFTMLPEWGMTFVQSVAPRRKIYNVSVTTSRALEFQRATDDDQAFPGTEHGAVQNAPVVEYGVPFNTILIDEVVRAVPDLPPSDPDRCILHPLANTAFIVKTGTGVHQTQNEQIKEGAHEAQTAALRGGPAALPQTAAEGHASPAPPSSPPPTFTPKPVIHKWTADEFPAQDWADFVRRGGRLEGTSRRALPPDALSMVMYYEDLTGVPFCVDDREPLREALRLTLRRMVFSGIRKCAEFPKHAPGMYLRRDGFSHVLNTIKGSPHLQSEARRKKKTGVKSGFDEKRALRARAARAKPVGGAS